MFWLASINQMHICVWGKKQNGLQKAEPPRTSVYIVIPRDYFAEIYSFLKIFLNFFFQGSWGSRSLESIQAYCSKFSKQYSNENKKSLGF